MKAEAPSATPKRIRPDWHADILHVVIILACGTAFRLIYQLAYKPFWSFDSIQYTDIFHFWYCRTFSTSDRPPVYPLFLGLMQWLSGDAHVESGMGIASQYLTARLQSVLGLAVALLVYFALRTLSVRPRLALAGGLGIALLGTICIFELFILTELLSLFFLTLGIFFFVRSMRAVDGCQPFSSNASASGLTFSLAILTRPENIVFCAAIIFVVLALAVRCYRFPKLRFAAHPLTRLALLLVVSAAPLTLCWMTWNLLSIGQFRLNTLNGVTRTESTYNMFNRVAPEDRVAGAILWQSYLLKNRNGQVYRHHVWLALPQLLEAAKRGWLPIAMHENLPENPVLLQARHWLSQRFGLQEHMMVNGQVVFEPVDLNDYLGRLSGRLARENPMLYLHNVADNFFNNTFDYSYAPPSLNETENPSAPEGGGVVRTRTLYDLTVWINRVEAPLLTVGYLLVLAYIFFSPLVLLGRNRVHFLLDGAVVALSTGAFATILCCCFFAAYYPEHGVPFLGVLVICVVFAASNSKRIIQFLGRTNRR